MEKPVEVLCEVVGCGGGALENTSGGRVTGANQSIVIFDSGMAFNNDGLVDAKAGTLAFAGSYTQTAGSTKLDGGAIASSSPLNIQGGSLDGSGTISGSVNNGGPTSPGFSPRLMAISGD